MIKKQLGLTMIELMVSMMLGLGLIAGVGQLFVQSQKSFALQRNLSDMTDDASFALEDLAKGILLAGYSDDGTTVNGYIGTNSTDNKLYYSFRLGDSSQLNNSVCITGSPSVGSIITVHIYNSPANVLSCKSNITAQDLISEVEKIEFRYGVKIAANSFYYAKAADVADWTKIFAVKVFLVVRSVDDKLTRNKIKYKIEDTEYTAVDNRLYKVFSKTIFLRANSH
ncbi:MAG: PilW family protein [Methylococcales bacterium]|nr:PilW family protein [Methylococcales bacterium]